MSFLGQALGNLGGEAGDAFVADRNYQMARMKAQSEAQQALAQAGYLQQHGNYLQTMAEQGRWQPIGNSPVLNPQTKQWEYIIRDVRHGTIQRIPAGAPANSIESIMTQLGGMPDGTMTPEMQQRLKLEALFKGATGSGSGVFSGQHGIWKQVPGGFQYGVYDQLSKEFTPASGVSKGLPQGMTTYMDSKGNIINQQYPSIGAAPSAVPAPPPAIAAKVPGGATAPGTRGGISGTTRKLATAPEDVMKQLSAMQNEKGLLGDIVKLLEQPDATGKPLYQTPQGMNRLQGMWNALLYSHGIHGDDTWDTAIQKGTLSGFAGVMGLIPGLRRGDLISQAMTHLPEGTDSFQQMYFKAKSMLPVYDRNMTNLISGAQMNAGGKVINQPASQTIKQLNDTAAPEAAPNPNAPPNPYRPPRKQR